MSSEKDKLLDKQAGSGWQEALRHAESEIRVIAVRTVQLRESIRIFRRKIAAGEPWPGAQSNRQDLGQQHSD
jgi:hypothetical protein